LHKIKGMKTIYAKIKWLKPSISPIKVSKTENSTCNDANKPNNGGDGGASQCS